MRLHRLPGNPIVRPDMLGSLGDNINGPSLVRAPDWLPNPIGRYYLYFAHHGGKFIRLACADDLAGPWHVHAPGTLQLAQTPFSQHIASPDVHVDHANRRLVMYYHGCCNKDPKIPWPQYTCVALSADGLTFESRTQPLCQSYLRLFTWRGRHYGIAMPGEFYRSDDGLTRFEARPGVPLAELCRPGAYERMKYQPRHFAAQVVGDTLRLFFTRIGDCPEHILLSTVALGDDWQRWTPTEPVSLVRPEHDWEGAAAQPMPSRPGSIEGLAYQLRDPAVFEDAGRTYLLYSVAGEHGLAIGELEGA